MGGTVTPRSVHKHPDSLPTALGPIGAGFKRQLATSSPGARGHVDVPLTRAEAGDSPGQALESKPLVGRSTPGLPP